MQLALPFIYRYPWKYYSEYSSLHPVCSLHTLYILYILHNFYTFHALYILFLLFSRYKKYHKRIWINNLSSYILIRSYTSNIQKYTFTTSNCDLRETKRNNLLMYSIKRPKIKKKETIKNNRDNRNTLHKKYTFTNKFTKVKKMIMVMQKFSVVIKLLFLLFISSLKILLSQYHPSSMREKLPSFY